jgi:rhamnosyltransferase
MMAPSYGDFMGISKIKASVVIPTLNGGAVFENCLEMLFKQKTSYRFEVIVIDSESDDGTADIARKFPLCLCHIDKKDFNHGLTRQWGVDLAHGDHVAFLSQDAIPADENWLSSLVEILENDEDVAGVYSRQIPYPGCDPIAKTRIENWVSGQDEKRITHISSRQAYDSLSPWNKRIFIDFDDVSSCLRKSIMKEFPYSKVEFGEEREWSKRVLEAGYKLVYEPKSKVYHSHGTTIVGNYKRAFIDHKAMKELLGVDFYSQVFFSSNLFVLRCILNQIKDDFISIKESDLGTFQKIKWMLYAIPVEFIEKIGCFRGAASAKLAKNEANRKKKIVLVSHDFPPDHYGGVAVYTYNLAKKLSEHDEVYVFYRKWSKTIPEYKVQSEINEAFSVTSINNNFCEKPDFLMACKDSQVDIAFSKFLSENMPDVIHFQFLGTGLSTGMVAIAKEYKIPTLLTLNDYWFMCPRGQMMNYKWELCSDVIEEKCARCVYGIHEPVSALEKCQIGRGALKIVLEEDNNIDYRIIDLSTKSNLIKSLLSRACNLILRIKKDPRILIGALNKGYLMIRGGKARIKKIKERNTYILNTLKEIDLLIAPSNFLREKYINFGIPPEKIIFSDYGMDTAIIKKSERSPSDRLIFGYMGTFMPTKGLHVLIDAFTKVPEDKGELRVYGYSPNKFHLEYLDLIERKMKEKNNIKLMGKYTIGELSKILPSLDILIVPSIWHENSPLTIHEAFMAGVPVITSDIGGMAELVKHKVNGLLFKVGDSEDLHRKIMILIENPRLLRELSINIPSVKSIDENAEELTKIYNDLIANARERRSH